MKGKYFLCVDEDGVLHSTDDFELYVMYNKMFNSYDVILKEKCQVTNDENRM